MSTPSSEGEDRDSLERAWQDLIDNYGERADLSDDLTAEGAGQSGSAEPDPTPSQPPSEIWRGPTGLNFDDIEEPFVPPEPPPAPRLPASKLVAWAGVLGAPVLVAVLGIARMQLPGLLVALLVVWFLSGFGYLVMTMPRRHQRDPGDDGSRI